MVQLLFDGREVMGGVPTIIWDSRFTLKLGQLLVKAVEKYGTGCSGSRYLNGTLDLHEELEQKLLIGGV